MLVQSVLESARVGPVTISSAAVSLELFGQSLEYFSGNLSGSVAVDAVIPHDLPGSTIQDAVKGKISTDVLLLKDARGLKVGKLHATADVAITLGVKGMSFTYNFYFF